MGSRLEGIISHGRGRLIATWRGKRDARIQIINELLDNKGPNVY